MTNRIIYPRLYAMINKLIYGARQIFDKYSLRLALLTAFLIPLKLSFAYLTLIPLTSIWLIINFKNLKSIVIKKEFAHILPLFIFIFIALYSSIFGIDIKQSLIACLSLFFYTCTAYAVCDAAKNGNHIKVALALLIGQTVTGFHSLLQEFIAGFENDIFLGKVSESGQIALSIFILLGLLLTLCKSSNKLQCLFLAYLALPLITLNLLINMKRGPWFGVLLALCVYLSQFARRLVPLLLLVVLGIFFLITPLQERLLQSYEHFSISGGRKVIWEIGGELSLRYPLGIGFNNSHILRKFATEIPPELKHFHNNYLNILVETGWLGLLAFLWWIISVLRFSWQDFPATQKILARALGCAIISWQLAGLVEYNFGDSKIFLVVMIVLGLLAAIKRDLLLSAKS